MILRRTNIDVLETWKGLVDAKIEFICTVSPGRIVTTEKESRTIKGEQRVTVRPRCGKASTIYAHILEENMGVRVHVQVGNWVFELIKDKGSSL